MPKGKDVGADVEWHAECDLEFRYQLKSDGVAAYWCAEHNQWTYVHPIGKTWHYKKLPDLEALNEN